MSITINVPDALRKQVESASKGLNTVLYTAKGQPSFMRVLPSFTVQSIDASLGTGTHPAFIVGGVTKSTLFLGMYPGVIRNEELISLPGVDPANNQTHDAFITLARNNGTGWHVMTNAEWAALGLRCWKDGWQPRGNTSHGRSSDDTAEEGIRSDGLTVTGAAQGSQGRTLTGSGPMSWRHDNTPWGMADLNGNVSEWSPGLRSNAGEINVITNNDAALNTTNFGASSAAWKAINGATGALVAPGTAGTVKYASANSGTADYTLYRFSANSFEGMANSTGANPVGETALQVLKTLGAFPIAGSGLGGDLFYLHSSGEQVTVGERVAIRGGRWDFGALAGVFFLDLRIERSNPAASLGARPAFVS